MESMSKYTLCDRLIEAPPSECEVCGCDDETFLSPSCGHGFCIQCWKVHASQRKIVDLFSRNSAFSFDKIQRSYRKNSNVFHTK